MPRQLAGFIARFTSAANLWANTVDRARSRNADLTYQGSATIAVALHASKMIVSKRAGDEIEIAIVLGGESGQSRENAQQAPQLRHIEAASGDFAAMPSLPVVKSYTPFPATRLSAQLSRQAACRPAIRISAETLITSRWNRQSADDSTSIG